MKQYKRKGQGIVEYAILVGLVAIVVYTLVDKFGSKLENSFSNFNSTIDNLDKTNN